MLTNGSGRDVRIRRILMAAAAAGAFTLGLLTTARGEERFDHKVRVDFFTGFNGDRAALDRGMKACEEYLAADPKHAEAMVWHGAGVYFQAGQAFQAGDRDKGMNLYERAMSEMDAAVALEPDNIAVRIPRGASLLTAARFQADSGFVRELIERGRSDYQRAYELQKDRLDRMGVHPRGELLMGLGYANSRLGDEEKARQFFELLAEKNKDTPYARRAQTWLEKKTLTAQESGCIGCHVQ